MHSLKTRWSCRPTSVSPSHTALVSMEPDSEPGAEAAWDAEIAQRIARFDSGGVQPVPAAEIFDRLHRIAPY